MLLAPAWPRSDEAAHPIIRKKTGIQEMPQNHLPCLTDGEQEDWDTLAAAKIPRSVFSPFFRRVAAAATSFRVSSWFEVHREEKASLKF